MVRGLDIFRKHFAEFADHVVLIGGTAAMISLHDEGMEFRATKNLDIVLHLEVIGQEFGSAFWGFVEAGGYEIRQASETGKPVFYRFQKPADPNFPVMLELFCRTPPGAHLLRENNLAPIPVGDSNESLSAILLNDEYYKFILSGRRRRDGLSWVGEDRLIPLKASAWLDLGERKSRGKAVDSRNIRKHANDVLRLSQLLVPELRVEVAPRIAHDLSRFLAGIEADPSIDTKTIGVIGSVREITGRISKCYGLDGLRMS